MIVTLLLIAMATRPAFVPVGDAEFGLQAELESQYDALARTAQPAPVTDAASAVPGRFLVGFHGGGESSARAAVRSEGGIVLRTSAALSYLVARFPAELDAGGLTTRIATAPGVRYCEQDQRVRACFMPNDPYFGTEQWGKWVMYSDKAWDVSRGDTSVTVAIVDNGTDYNHPDLVDRFTPGSYGRDIIYGDNDPRPDNPGWEPAFHGSHVSGISAATMDNATGVAGWAGVRLMSVRVLDDSGSGTMSDVADGVIWAAQNGADVINMSLAGEAAPSALVDACRQAYEAGVLIVAAGGNDGRGSISYPAALDYCLCVGATDESGWLASFSNYGPQQEVVAPGTSILSCAPGGNYQFAGGTSMASPQVAGVAALVMSAFPGLTASRVRSCISASAVDMGSTGRDNSTGFGMVNARRALDIAATLTARTAATPGPRATLRIVRGGFILPRWVDRASVYDGLGRLRREWNGGVRTLELGPGAWFVRADGDGQAERYKVLVAD